VSFIYRSNLDLKIDALVSRSEHTPFWCRCRGSRVSDGRVITWRSWIKPLGAAAALAGVLYSEPHLLQQIWIPWRSLSSPKHPSFIPVKKKISLVYSPCSRSMEVKHLRFCNSLLSTSSPIQLRNQAQSIFSTEAAWCPPQLPCLVLSFFRLQLLRSGSSLLTVLFYHVLSFVLSHRGDHCLLHTLL
jgi:hypothetical protein